LESHLNKIAKIEPAPMMEKFYGARVIFLWHKMISVKKITTMPLA